jgi:hypothetical protein
MNRTPLLLWSAVLLCLATPSHAAEVNAASCSQSAVQAAINSAVNGDTVRVPPGNCTWTSTITIAGKDIALQGAGIGQTDITDEGSGGAALGITASAANFVSVSGFTFVKSAAHSNGIVQISGPQAEVAFRFHHNRILQASSGARGIGVNGVYGLIDHVTFDVTATGGSVQSVSITGSPDGTDGGFTPWTRPLTLGTANAVYIEDSTFNSSTQAEDSIDAYGGARLVIRSNTFNSVSIGFHGTDSGDRRSAFSWEIYSNIFRNDSATTLRGATLRGGTGVIYNNTYRGRRPWYGITMLVYRACPPADQSGWQTCNGTPWEIGSTNFSANASRVCSTNGGVRFCSGNRDLVCTSDSTCSAGGAGTCTTYFDGPGAGGYPCRDQVGRTSKQALAPVYAWNNGSVHLGTYDGGGNSCGLGIDNYVQSGRDYYDGVVMPGYMAYTYPHPLQEAASPPARRPHRRLPHRRISSAGRAKTISTIGVASCILAAAGPPEKDDLSANVGANWRAVRRENAGNRVEWHASCVTVVLLP